MKQTEYLDRLAEIVREAKEAKKIKDRQERIEQLNFISGLAAQMVTDISEEA